MRYMWGRGEVAWLKSDVIYWVGYQKLDRIGKGQVGISKIASKNRTSYINGPFDHMKYSVELGICITDVEKPQKILPILQDLIQSG